MVHETTTTALFNVLRARCGGLLSQVQVDAGDALIRSCGQPVWQLFSEFNLSESVPTECGGFDIGARVAEMYAPEEIMTVFNRLRVLHGGRLSQSQVTALDMVLYTGHIKLVESFLGVKEYDYLSEDKLRQISPRADMSFVKHIVNWAPAFGITTQPRLSGWLANMLFESNQFRSLRENLNYSPTRFYEVFRSRAGSLANARRICKAGPVAIANAVYNGRLGNRTGTNDGYDFRGGGLTHTTGRYNYRATGLAIGVPLEKHPEMIVDPEVATRSAMWYWSHYKCNEAMDSDNFDRTCVIINAGPGGKLRHVHGLRQRRALYKKISLIL